MSKAFLGKELGPEHEEAVDATVKSALVAPGQRPSSYMSMVQIEWFDVSKEHLVQDCARLIVCPWVNPSKVVDQTGRGTR